MAVESRLIPSVSSSPRREVHGGLPIRQPHGVEQNRAASILSPPIEWRPTDDTQSRQTASLAEPQSFPIEKKPEVGDVTSPVVTNRAESILSPPIEWRPTDDTQPRQTEVLPEPQSFPIEKKPEASLPPVESVTSPSIVHDALPQPARRSESQPQPALPEAQGAIERLIESTVLPGPLPELEMRLVSPSERTSTTDVILSEQTMTDDSTSPMPMPESSPTPEIDINEVADKVLKTLQRRQQLERERKGLY